MPNRILIAAADSGVRQVLETSLAGVAREIQTAIDDADVMEKATSFAPEVIVLDIGPGLLDGWNVCKQLKMAPATRPIRILAILSVNKVSDLERAVAAGADDLVSKPMDPGELIGRVEKLLEK